MGPRAHTGLGARVQWPRLSHQPRAAVLTASHRTASSTAHERTRAATESHVGTPGPAHTSMRVYTSTRECLCTYSHVCLHEHTDTREHTHSRRITDMRRRWAWTSACHCLCLWTRSHGHVYAPVAMQACTHRQALMQRHRGTRVYNAYTQASAHGHIQSTRALAVAHTQLIHNYAHTGAHLCTGAHTLHHMCTNTHMGTRLCAMHVCAQRHVPSFRGRCKQSHSCTCKHTHMPIPPWHLHSCKHTHVATCSHVPVHTTVYLCPTYPGQLKVSSAGVAERAGRSFWEDLWGRCFLSPQILGEQALWKG